jgi:hypothetical protein
MIIDGASSHERKKIKPFHSIRFKIKVSRNSKSILLTLTRACDSHVGLQQ